MLREERSARRVFSSAGEICPIHHRTTIKEQHMSTLLQEQSSTLSQKPSVLARLLACVAPRRPDDTGEYVAEVYLTWFFGKGTTLFRQRYASMGRAQRAARLQARFLDMILPHYYWAEDWSGRKYREAHEYGINWSARSILDGERENFPAIDRHTLPGEA
jgi:hypothetical protein